MNKITFGIKKEKKNQMKMGFRQIVSLLFTALTSLHTRKAVPGGDLVFVEEREQMYYCSQMYKCSERSGLKKIKIPVEKNSPSPVFLYLIAMYNGIKNMKQMWCSGKKKKKGNYTY